MPVDSGGGVNRVGVTWRKPHHHYPWAFCFLPNFARIKRPRWKKGIQYSVALSNITYLKGEEQSNFAQYKLRSLTIFSLKLVSFH